MPSVWPDGEIKGLRARGGFEIDIKWAGGRIETVRITSTIGGNCRLRSLTPLKGKGLKSAKGDNTNSLFDVNEAAAPIVSPEAELNPVSLRKTYLYDLPTKAGQTYILTGK